MNTHDQSFSRIQEVLQKGTSGSIVLPANPTVDAIAAASALYLGLHKLGKTVSITCEEIKQKTDLIASDKIQSNMTTGGDSLVVSFPYTDGSIDKVDYNIQGNMFNLIVAPRQGFPKLEPNQVKYSYTGGLLDFIIVLDSPTLNSLGTVYRDNEKQFQGRDIVNIDRHLTNSFFGTINFVEKTSSSISELILKLLQNLQVEIDRDIATNLYAGIASATNNFTSYSVNADTFEHIATLLRMGAIKKVFRKPVAPLGQNGPFQPTKKAPMFERRTVKPIEGVEKEPQAQEQQTPQDWLKPKIFRGGGGSLL
ncbi:hypothetical protein HYW87_03775 [Candidatus Roizmanbacteria bacterium]|nr:hypothetical protein [Candidatus Roizmanbacteria bacterium]